MSSVLANLAFFCGLYSLLSLGLRFSWRDAGVISLAHASFYGVGAYSATILAFWFANGGSSITIFDFLVCLFVASGAAACISGTLGLLLKRIPGDHFVMVTFVFAEMVRNLVANNVLLGGNMGLRGVPAAQIGERILSHGWLAALTCGILVALTGGFSARLIRSRLKLAAETVKQDELLAVVTGHSVFFVRWRSFVLSGAVAGVAGAIAAPYFGYIDPTFFDITETIFIVTCLCLSTSDEPWVTVLAASFLVLLETVIAWLPMGPDLVGASRQLMIGAFLLGVVVLRPESVLKDVPRRD